MQEEYIMFLRELNGFYCNGYSVFGCYDYEIDLQQYTLITNGTLDVLYQSDFFNSFLSRYLEDL